MKKKGNIKYLKGNTIDRTGQVYNNWTFISYIGSNKHKESIWLCRCSCGNIQESVTGNIVSGGSKQCRECADKTKPYAHELSDVFWKQISSRSVRKNFEFTITKEYAYDIFLRQNKKCALSGVDIFLAQTPRDVRFGIRTASLDRIDSLKGYVPGNVQWVHKDINIMKNSMTQEQFIIWCKLVAKKNK